MGIVPRKTPKYPLWADDLTQIRKSIKEVINKSAKIVYTGHGGPFSPEVIIDRFKEDIDFYE